MREEMGPAESGCPAWILDQLTPPSNDKAAEWRQRCRDGLARQRPRKGETVVFENPVKFDNGEEHRTLVFQGGSRFR
ncbi:MAG: hypothetical protein WBM00_08725, partial [Solirubrobacterales bacterium]